MHAGVLRLARALLQRVEKRFGRAKLDIPAGQKDQLQVQPVCMT
jgi:hypothetical protein